MSLSNLNSRPVNKDVVIQPSGFLAPQATRKRQKLPASVIQLLAVRLLATNCESLWVAVVT
jgi:hypothetical protein